MIKYKRLEWTSEQVSKFWDYESKFPENYFSKQVGNNLAAYIKNSFQIYSIYFDSCLTSARQLSDNCLTW